ACEEMRSQMLWLRARNSDPSRERLLRFYGIDMSFWFTKPPSAVEGVFSYLERVDSSFVKHLRDRIESVIARFVAEDRPPPPSSLSPIPLESFDGLPNEGYLHAPMVWHSRVLDDLTRKYGRLGMEVRNDLTATLSELLTRFEDRRLAYIAMTSED